MSAQASSFVDSHENLVAADPLMTWGAVLETIDAAFGHGRAIGYARIVGCVPYHPAGPRPLQSGSAVAGFFITAFHPQSELRMEGEHRFASYSLTFDLESVGTGTRLRATTQATFPLLRGKLYRKLVVDTGFHVRAVRRLLAQARRRAETSWTAP